MFTKSEVTYVNTIMETCVVCLKTDPNLHKITETDEHNPSLVTKLSTCVPEINWDEKYMICPPCITDLNFVYEFRSKCINSEEIRSRSSNLGPPKKLNCDLCEKISNTSTPAVSHSHKIKRFLCHICNNKFATSSNLTQHLKYHDGSRAHMCPFCGKSYKTKTDLSVHEKIHLDKKEYKCEECLKSFNTHKDLRSHKWVVHTDPSLWRHECELCSKRFPIKSNFDAHMRRHRNERPFGCHLCDKKFVVKSVLQKHILSHTNTRGFLCEICSKEYKNERVRDVHMKRIHDIGDVKVPPKVKKYLCHKCPKSYYDKNKLTRHLWTHEGAKPYSCKICQKSFGDKSYVKQHMKKTHSIEEESEES